MKNKLKKGFTIVELVIVIAVIGILAAVLIPTFTSLNRKAKISADTQLAKNMNTVLDVDSAEHGKAKDMTQVLTIIKSEGYVIENLNPTTEGYYYAWDQENNQILLLNEKLDVYYPENSSIDKAQCWVTVGNENEARKIANEGFSIYLESNIGSLSIDKWVSVDTGLNQSTGKVSIKGNAEKEITLRGNFNQVEVDNSKGDAKQYGIIKDLNVKSIAQNCFYINGYVENATIASGKIKNLGVVKNEIQCTGTGIKINNGIENNISNGSVVISINSATELQNLALAINNGADYSKATIKITDDIDLSNRSWTPIGTSNNQFEGIIDGDGHKISNLSNSGYVGGTSFVSLAGTSGYPFGLIAYAHGNVKISRLTVDAKIKDEDNKTLAVAAFIGIYNTDKQGTLTFESCKAEGSIIAQDKVAGFVGTTYKTGESATKVTFTSCINNANIKANSTKTYGGRAGGFIGTFLLYQENGATNEQDKAYLTFSSCQNKGTVQGNGNGSDVYYGAVIGFVGNGNVLTNNYTANLTGVSNDVENLSKVGHFFVSGENNSRTNPTWIGLDD